MRGQILAHPHTAASRLGACFQFPMLMKCRRAAKPGPAMRPALHVVASQEASHLQLVGTSSSQEPWSLVRYQFPVNLSLSYMRWGAHCNSTDRPVMAMIWALYGQETDESNIAGTYGCAHPVSAAPGCWPGRTKKGARHSFPAGTP